MEIAKVFLRCAFNYEPPSKSCDYIICESNGFYVITQIVMLRNMKLELSVDTIIDIIAVPFHFKTESIVNLLRYL